MATMNREAEDIIERSSNVDSEPDSSSSAVDELVSMSLFLNDNFIKSLIEKCINLGFSLESIMDLLKHNFRPVSAELIDYLIQEDKRGVAVDLSAFIKDEIFIQQLISKNEAAFQNIVRKSSKVSSSNSDDFSDGDGMFRSSFDENSRNRKAIDMIQMQQFQQQDLQRQHQQILLETQNKKAQMIQKLQQEHLDQYNQSLSRINSKSNLRPIIVDSNDVASPNNSSKQVFIFSRIVAVVNYFENLNHQVYVILSQWRREQIMASSGMSSSNYMSQSSSQANNGPHDPSEKAYTSMNKNSNLTPDQQSLLEMEQKGQILCTPSKRVGSKRIICDDDSYILKLAATKGGIIVSNDNFKRFLNHSDDFKLVIEERVLMYSFIDGTFMPAEDPLGKNGPNLANFLRFESLVNQHYMKRCPYRKKCTYGAKCKFWHPERVLNQSGILSGYKSIHQTILDDVQEQRKKMADLFNSKSTTGRPCGVESSNFAMSIAYQNENVMRQSGYLKPVPMGMLGPKNPVNNVQSGQFNFPGQSVNHQPIVSQYSNEISSNSNLLRMMNRKPDSQSEIIQKILETHKFNPHNPSPSSSSSSSSNFNLEKGLANLILASADNETGREASTNNLNAIISSNKDDHKENNDTTGNGDSGDLRSQLLKKLDQDKVDRVLREYKNETDVEKLVFLAGAYSFDSFGF